MRRASLVAVVLTALAAASCGSGAVTDVQSSAEARAAVEKTTAAFHDALRNNDLERFMTFVADDVVMAPGGEAPVRGKEALRQWLERFLATYRTTTLTLADREVVVGDDWAVELGTYEWALAPAAGGPPTVDRGSYMQLWKQQPDRSWRFAREVFSSAKPPAAPETLPAR